MIFSLDKSFIIKLINLGLRIGGMGSKFIIFALMSKHLSGKVFGDYSLIISVITILIFVLGLDFYNFSIRDILTTKDFIKIKSKVYTTFFLYLLIYVVFTTLGFIVFSRISYIKPFIWSIILLCITEHISQEIYRLLIGFKKVLFANILLFIRTMGWAIIIFYFLFIGQHVTLDLIFNLWLSANLLTIFYVFFYVVLKNKSHFKYLKVDGKWIKKGIRICYLFFIATICLKIMEYSNRFIVNHYLGKEIAGVFTFYSSISILITVYINTIVISYELPPLISGANTANISFLFKKFKKSISTQLIIASFLLFVIIKPLLIWQNKPIFDENLPLLIFMVIGVGLMNYSLTDHFKLYVFHKDFSIFKIMIISSVSSLLITIIGTHFFGLYGSAISFVLSGLLICYLRHKEARKIKL